ncbi:MAG: membrane protein insertase YidC [Paramuribaculum sp.]|nr:membrane protein insertase YidC [Paramuribaculum sp.]
MDKNTIWGMLLMGAVIFGFMWLNKPSEEEIARQRELAQAEAQADSARTQPELLTVDTITASEKAAIANTIRALGEPDSATGGFTLTAKDATLALSENGQITGSVMTTRGSVDMADILSSNFNGINLQTAKAAVSNLRESLQAIAKYHGFAKYLSGREETVTLENKLLKLELSTKGGVISRATLKDYKSFDSTAVELMDPTTDGYSFTLTTSNQHIETRDFYFNATQESDTTVLMSLDLGDGAMWGIRYILLPGGYTVGMQIVQQNMQKVIPTSVASFDFNWHQKMARNEAGRMFEERNSALYYMFANGDIEHLSETKSASKDVSERVKWIAFKNQFFSAIMIPNTYFTNASLNSEVLEGNENNYLKNLSAQASMEYSSASPTPAQFTIFFGPNSYPLLSDLQDEIEPGHNLHLTNLIPLGWSLFRWINTLIIIPVFTFLGGFISNYGIIILLLTIFIKIILFPFTYKSYMSQAKTRVLQPEIKEINEKYPGNENAMKRQQETMALYTRAGANPMSGCLPTLLQFPILIAMYNFFPSAIELRGEPFLWAKDLSAPDVIISWNANIPLISNTFGNHISLFCLLMTVVNIIYTKVTMQSQAGSSAMPGMKWMMYLMPVMFLVFFNNYASGLSYYYFLSLLITIIQTYIFRKVVSEEKVRATMRENAKKPKKKGGFMARLEEAQRRQQALLREQEKRKKGNGRR